ncbi:hypothetical protein METBIDRAFT_117096 [Metschnikowia bicuspidata var. bicuspidata NRRL YB-4993]|uniref:Uncharacterized protein n=1 Tax=Metschnikowia bicuspidata var. bicuspidata NRRL YB-4993 TaxID=869754 RepID=A0A1A0HIT9_9ASCO|nr:hypothetical protein METBIDRAFT_117096 [Metschnikowia bicuspidata var. bicuspidata NRRL YB-4993]OBA24074.1 hypothetical protein METBIDRAFT_117096 [Metschnikowia bicuspidata var. bicuspidata NRRL YB-4993]
MAGIGSFISQGNSSLIGGALRRPLALLGIRLAGWGPVVAGPASGWGGGPSLRTPGGARVTVSTLRGQMRGSDWSEVCSGGAPPGRRTTRADFRLPRGRPWLAEKLTGSRTRPLVQTIYTRQFPAAPHHNCASSQDIFICA